MDNNDELADPRGCRDDSPGFGWFDKHGVVRLRLFTNAYYRDLRAAFDALHAQIKIDGASRANFEEAVQRITGRVVERP